MKIIKIVILVIIVISNTDSFAQRYFTSVSPGYLGKKFYVTGQVGISPLIIYSKDDLKSSITNFLSFAGGVNYTVAKNKDLGLKAAYGSFELTNGYKSASYMQIQPRFLWSNQIAPLGNRVGLGINIDNISLTYANDSTAKETLYSLAIIAERNIPINKSILLTYGVEVGIPFNMDTKGSTKSIVYVVPLSNFLKMNFGVCYMLF